MSQSFDNHPATNAVVITLGDVYAEVRSMREEINGLVASMTPVARQVDDHETRLRHLDALPDAVEDLEKQVEDHETRLRQVERGRWMVAGGAAALAGTAGSLISWALSAHH